MIVTSLSALAASVRSTLSRSRSSTVTPSPSAASAMRVPAPADSVQLSGHAVTLVKALDADGDGLVTKDEFTEGAIELLKRASVRFHHQRIGRGEGIERRDQRWTGRIEDAFLHVDTNHDGGIDTSELSSALPKPVQRPEQRQSFSANYTATGAPTPRKWQS